MMRSRIKISRTSFSFTYYDLSIEFIDAVSVLPASRQRERGARGRDQMLAEDGLLGEMSGFYDWEGLCRQVFTDFPGDPEPFESPDDFIQSNLFKVIYADYVPHLHLEG